MVKNHLQRIASPSSWGLERKNHKYITRVTGGSHTFEDGISVNTLLKEMLGVTSNTRETKFILNNKEVLVNNRPIHDIHHGVGLMDTLSLPKSNQHYRILLDTRGKLITLQIDDPEKNILRINNKSVVKGKKQVLHLHGGINLLSDASCNVGDGVLLEKNNMKNIISLKEGAYVMLTGGRNIGKFGKIVRIFEDHNSSMVEIQSDKESFITLKKFSYVLGENQSEVKIE